MAKNNKLSHALTFQVNLLFFSLAQKAESDNHKATYNKWIIFLNYKIMLK